MSSNLNVIAQNAQTMTEGVEAVDAAARAMSSSIGEVREQSDHAVKIAARATETAGWFRGTPGESISAKICMLINF